MHSERSECRAVERRNRPARKPKAGGARVIAGGSALPAGGDGQRGMMKIEIGMEQSHQSSVISEQSAVAADPGSGGVRSEMLGSFELTMWRGGFVSQSAGGESVGVQDCPEFARGAGPAPSGTPRPSSALALLQRLERVDCYVPARSGEDTAVGQRGILTLDHDPSSVVPHAGRRMDLNHNLVLSGPARTLFENPSESGCGFVSYDIGGEMLTPQECPEIGRGGGGRGGGIKAVEGYRSPRPGGIRGGLEHDVYPWELRRGERTMDEGWAGMRRKAESGGGVSFWKILEVKC